METQTLIYCNRIYVLYNVMYSIMIFALCRLKKKRAQKHAFLTQELTMYRNSSFHGVYFQKSYSTIRHLNGVRLQLARRGPNTAGASIRHFLWRIHARNTEPLPMQLVLFGRNHLVIYHLSWYIYIYIYLYTHYTILIFYCWLYTVHVTW